MARFLCFRLHGPLSSWGDVAVGERRPSAPHPTRSAALGLVAAALGIRREDPDACAELDRCFGFASRTDAPGDLLVDFHTAQGPDEKQLRAQEKDARRTGIAWYRPATRRAELAFRRAALSTLLSSRQYRMDALATIALWLRPGTSGRWTLEMLRDALLRPTFVLYLGRKGCPLDIPLEPQLIDAADPVAAMAGTVFCTDELLLPFLPAPAGSATVQWEDAWPGVAPEQTVRRRDRVLSRTRWQFAEREEHQKAWAPPKGGRDVPEQG